MAGLTRADLVKAAVAEAVARATERLRLADYQVTSMRSELSKVAGAMAAGGPSHTFAVTGARGEPVTTKAAPKADDDAARAERYERLAYQVTDPDTRRGYLALAAQHRNARQDHA